jgi:hypothetical protein
MGGESLHDKVFLAYDLEKKNLQFSGFTPPSIDFYNDFPLVEAEAAEWWSSKRGNNNDGDYDLYLKPEFEALIEDITRIIVCVDSGIETELSKNIGNTHGEWTGPRAHRWAAIHTKGRDKRIDVQFFINLTTNGLRVGIYIGKNKLGLETWKSFMQRLHTSKERVFAELKNLEKLGYLFINTDHKDYVEKSDGVMTSPNTSDEMYERVSKYKEFDILLKFDREELCNELLIDKILECFIQTRKIYELLQLSKFNHYQRGLTNVK